MVVTTKYQINGRHLERGTEVSISGERGRFRFFQAVVNGKSEWIDVIDRDRKVRSFYPDRVKRVHYKKKLR